MKAIVAAALPVLAIASAAHAGVQAFHLGTDAPPAVFDGVAFTPFALDAQPILADVFTVALDGSDPPSGVVIGFSQERSHRRVGDGWATWSHGYTGDVYTDFTFSTPNLITVPVGTQGYMFYLEPGPFQEYTYTISATTSSGATASLVEAVHGFAGAEGFAFLADPGETVVSISIIGPPFQSHAVGEFSIAMAAPDPADLNGDGDVDGMDLAVLLASWGRCGAPSCPADLDSDGDVDGSDLAELLAAWG